MLTPSGIVLLLFAAAPDAGRPEQAADASNVSEAALDTSDAASRVVLSSVAHLEGRLEGISRSREPNRWACVGVRLARAKELARLAARALLTSRGSEGGRHPWVEGRLHLLAVEAGQLEADARRCGETPATVVLVSATDVAEAVPDEVAAKPVLPPGATRHTLGLRY